MSSCMCWIFSLLACLCYCSRVHRPRIFSSGLIWTFYSVVPVSILHRLDYLFQLLQFVYSTTCGDSIEYSINVWAWICSEGYAWVMNALRIYYLVPWKLGQREWRHKMGLSRLCSQHTLSRPWNEVRGLRKNLDDCRSFSFHQHPWFGQKLNSFIKKPQQDLSSLFIFITILGNSLYSISCNLIFITFLPKKGLHYLKYLTNVMSINFEILI